jgi:hypothetical protein
MENCGDSWTVTNVRGPNTSPATSRLTGAYTRPACPSTGLGDTRDSTDSLVRGSR